MKVTETAKIIDFDKTSNSGEVDEWKCRAQLDPRKQELLERRMSKLPLALNSDSFCIPDTVSGDEAKAVFESESSIQEVYFSSVGEITQVTDNQSPPTTLLPPPPPQPPSISSSTPLAEMKTPLYSVRRETMKYNLQSESSGDNSRSGLESFEAKHLQSKTTPRKQPEIHHPNSATCIYPPTSERQLTPTATPSRNHKRPPNTSPSKKISDYFSRRATSAASPAEKYLDASPLERTVKKQKLESLQAFADKENKMDSVNHSSAAVFSSTGFKTLSKQTQTDSLHSTLSSSCSSCSGFANADTASQQETASLQLKSEIQGLMKKISTLEGKSSQLAMENQLLKDEKEKIVPHLKELIQRCSVNLKDFLIREAKRDRKETRKEALKNNQRLCNMSYQRQGAEFVEAWDDGFAVKEHFEKVKAIAMRRENVEKERRLLGKKRTYLTRPKKTDSDKSSSDKKDSTSDSSKEESSFVKPALPGKMEGDMTEDMVAATLESLSTHDEILKLRLAALKKEEFDLQAEFEKLELLRTLHVAELKRIKDEDSSRFNTYPCLNNRYLLLNLLGKGGFSEVYKAFDLSTFRYAALKIHQLNSQWNESKKANYIKHAFREYNIHKCLNHARVVSLYDVFEIDSDSFATVLEYCEGRDLDFYLKQCKIMTEREAKSIIVQILSALKYLNEIKPPVIHYDLKPANVLFNQGEVKITDFGLSKIMEEDGCNSEGMELTSQGAGTYWYLPPECFETGKLPPKISSKVDVWSVGVIFYQCLYGEKPFGNNLSQQTILHEGTILNAKAVEFPPKPPVSKDTKAFIRTCLMYRKEDRPDVLTLCADPYLKLK